MAISKVKSVFSTYTLDDSIEQKNYHRVLFKPGVSVQARELTELQTNLQRQIDYHGQYAFKEGSRVTGGEVALSLDYAYIKVESSMVTGGTTYNSAGFISNIANTGSATLTNANGVVAEVLQVISEAGVDLADSSNKTGILDSGNTSDPLTLYVKYVEGSGGTNSNTFAVGEVLTSSTDTTNHKLMVGGGTDTDENGTNSTIGNAVGEGSKVEIKDGVYFIAGNFVYVAADKIILDKYSNTPSNIIGLNVTESVVNSTDDTTLVDNAAGYPNASAPGAERYKIATQLIKADPASPHSAYTNYIILFKVQEGVKEVEVAPKSKADTELTKRLARRTNEESGDYSINPFILDIKEHLDDGTNNGYKILDDGGDDSKYVVAIEPNIAYVQGYRTENIATRYVEVDKPREESTEPYDYVDYNNATTTLEVGSYVKIDTSTTSTSVGLPDITNFSEMVLKNTDTGANGAVALFDNISFTPPAGGQLGGRYYYHDDGTTGLSSSGSGSGARFMVVLDNDDNSIVDILITDGGSGYSAGDTFTILGTKFAGGATTANDLTFDIAALGHGTARCRGVSYESANILRLHLFNIRITSGTFSGIDRIEQLETLTGGGADNTFFANLAAHGRRYDGKNHSSVYKLPFTAVKTAEADDHPSYQIQKRLYIDDAGGSGTYTFSNVLATDENLVGTTAIVSIGAGQASGNYVKTNLGVAAQPSGTKNITVSLTGIANGKSLCAIVTVEKSGAISNKKTKTFHTVTDKKYEFRGGTVHLGKYDIYDLVSVKQGSATGPDVTHLFKLHNGQTSSYYGEGLISPKGVKRADGDIYVTFRHYEHGAGDYLIKDSYSGIASSTGHKMENIPKLKLWGGEEVDLKDCIDFRPVKAPGYTSNDSTTSIFSETGAVSSPAVAPGSILTIDGHGWLGRTDKLVLSRSGDYSVIKGVTSEDPVEPEDPMDSMVIGTIKVSPYTYDAKKHTASALYNHKRYTMRHIGEIESRVKNLEYYSALSMLETEALNMSISDTSSSTNTFERFKNGVFAEPFKGHANANVKHPDYHCSIDKEEGAVRPMFFEESVNLVRKDGDTGGVVLNGSIFTLPFSSVNHIVQPAATTSEYINPYNVFTWDGSLELSPDTDEWKDTQTRPDVIINDNGQYDQMVRSLRENGTLGTVWNEWQTNWTGVSRERGRERRTRFAFGDGSLADNPWVRGSGRLGVFQNSVTTTRTASQSRSGMVTSVVPDVQTRELGSKVVETNFIPFIRSREVYFKAEMLKPNTKVYAFFDEKDVTNYCAPKNFVNFSSRRGIRRLFRRTQHESTSRGNLITDSAGNIEGSFFIPNNSSLKFRTGTRQFRLSDSSVNNVDNETTYAEADYFAQGLLEIKENTIISTKVPRVVRREVNQSRVIRSRTTGTETRTRWFDPLAQTILIQQEGGLFATGIDIFVHTKDAALPINISIRETENGIPTQKIVPGSETLVYPTAGTGSAINKIYDNMAGSQNTTGTVPCPVTFKHPVYLSQDTEYAIVILSNSDSAKVFIAETGQFDIATGARVAKQPYNGVFFTSQNASTWTPEQTKDLKFTLKRAHFTNSNSTLSLNNDTLPVRNLNPDPFFICESSSANTAVIRVYHSDHGMVWYHSKVEIAGATGFAGIQASELNGTHTVRDVERDSYTIQFTTTNAITGEEIFGGGSTVTASENTIADAFVPYAQELTLPSTSLSYKYKYFQTRPLDGSGEAFVEIQNWRRAKVNETNFLHYPLAIASSAEHANDTGELEQAGNNIGTNKSFLLECKFRTSNPFLSPVIDADRLSLFCISNRTNDTFEKTDSSNYDNNGDGRYYVPDTASENCSHLNNYITKEITLANEASQLNVYCDVYKPNRSNVYLYYKVQELGDDSEFDDLGWTLLEPSEPIPTNDSESASPEYQVNLADVATLPDKFISFAFKIVFVTRNSAKPPTVKAFRAIATT